VTEISIVLDIRSGTWVAENGNYDATGADPAAALFRLASVLSERLVEAEREVAAAVRYAQTLRETLDLLPPPVVITQDEAQA
jgi:hypothetical protein